MKIRFLLAFLGLAAAAHEGLTMHRRRQHQLQQQTGVVDVPVAAGNLVEIILGSRNQTTNFTLSMNSDFVFVASSLCTTCSSKFYQ